MYIIKRRTIYTYPYYVGTNDKGVVSWSNRKEDAQRLGYFAALMLQYKLDQQTVIERVK